MAGTSYEPKGEIQNFEKFVNGSIPANIKAFVNSMTICNESKLILDEDRVNRSGLPTEAALKVLAEKIGRYDNTFASKFDSYSLAGVEQYGPHLAKEIEKLATLEFSRDRKSMSVLAKDGKNNKNVMFIKGAPDYLLDSSRKVLDKSGNVIDFSEAGKKVFRDQIEAYSKEGLRTLAICIKYETGELADYDGPNHRAHQKLTEFGNYK